MKMTYKESVRRLVRDGSDHQSLRTALESHIDPMNPVTHVEGSLLNMPSGQLTQPNVNVDKALDIGTRQLTQFEASWPEGFYNSLSKQVVTFSTKKKRLTIGVSAVVDQEAIYSRVIGLLVSQRDLNMCLPQSLPLGHHRGQMRVATKSTLKKMFQVEVSQRLTIIPTAIVMGVSSVLWTVAGHLMQMSKRSYQVSMCGFLFGCWKLMYISASIDIEITPRRAALDLHTFVHQLDLKTPPARDAVLKNCAKKVQLNTFIGEQILIDEDYLQNVTPTPHVSGY